MGVPNWSTWNYTWPPSDSCVSSVGTSLCDINEQRREGGIWGERAEENFLNLRGWK